MSIADMCLLKYGRCVAQIRLMEENTGPGKYSALEEISMDRKRGVLCSKIQCLALSSFFCSKRLFFFCIFCKVLPLPSLGMQLWVFVRPRDGSEIAMFFCQHILGEYLSAE